MFEDVPIEIALPKIQGQSEDKAKRSFFSYVKNGNLIICDALLREGLDVNCKDNHSMTALHWAVENNKPLMVSFLIQRGADPNAVSDETLQTPVTIAAKKNRVSILKYLIDHGGNEFYCDSRNVSILCYAVSSSAALATEYLLHRGHTLIKDAGGRHAIHWAAAGGDPMCLTLLCMAFPDHVNDRDNEGLTPLHYGLLHDKGYGCRVLIEHGAQLSAKSRAGEDCVEYAKRKAKERWDSKYKGNPLSLLPTRNSSDDTDTPRPSPPPFTFTSPHTSASTLYSEAEEARVAEHELQSAAASLSDDEGPGPFTPGSFVASFSHYEPHYPINMNLPGPILYIRDRLIRRFRPPHPALVNHHSLPLAVSGQLAGDPEVVRLVPVGELSGTIGQKIRNFFAPSVMPMMVLILITYLVIHFFFDQKIHLSNITSLYYHLLWITILFFAGEFSDPGRLPLAPSEHYSNGLWTIPALLRARLRRSRGASSTSSSPDAAAAAEEGRAGTGVGADAGGAGGRRRRTPEDARRMFRSLYHLDNPLILFFALVFGFVEVVRSAITAVCRLILRVVPPFLHPILRILSLPLVSFDEHFRFLPVRCAFGYGIEPTCIPSSSPRLRPGQTWAQPTATLVYNLHSHPAPFPTEKRTGAPGEEKFVERDDGFVAPTTFNIANCDDMTKTYNDILHHGCPVQLCSTCRRPRPQRCKHCNICGYCVTRLDHHCAFINNCVGTRNYPIFLACMWATTTGVFRFMSAMHTAIELDSIAAHDAAVAAGAASVPTINKLYFLNYPMFLIRFGWHHPLYFMSYLLLLLLAFFTGSLVVQHVYLLWSNYTTAEGQNPKKYPHFTAFTGEAYNPFSRRPNILTADRLQNESISEVGLHEKRMNRRIAKQIPRRARAQNTTTTSSSSSSSSSSTDSLSSLLLPPRPHKPRSPLVNIFYTFRSEFKKDYERLSSPPEVVLLNEGEQMDEWTLNELPHLPPDAKALAPFTYIYTDDIFLKDPSPD